MDPMGVIYVRPGPCDLPGETLLIICAKPMHLDKIGHFMHITSQVMNNLSTSSSTVNSLPFGHLNELSTILGSPTTTTILYLL